jgi:transposase-like protein
MYELLDQVLESSSRASARERLEAVTSELKEKVPAALEVLKDGFFDATAVPVLPGEYQRRLRTTNSLERLIQEIRRREKVIRIVPSRSSAWRLIRALLAGTHEERRPMKNGQGAFLYEYHNGESAPEQA